MFFKTFFYFINNFSQLLFHLGAFCAFINNFPQLLFHLGAFCAFINNFPQLLFHLGAFCAFINNFSQLLFHLGTFCAFINNFPQTLIFIYFHAILISVAKPAHAGVRRNPALCVHTKPRSKGLARRSPPINVPSVRDLPLVKQN